MWNDCSVQSELLNPFKRNWSISCHPNGVWWKITAILENGIINPYIPEDLARFLAAWSGRRDETICSFSVVRAMALIMYGTEISWKFMKSDASRVAGPFIFPWMGKVCEQWLRLWDRLMSARGSGIQQVEQNHPIFSPASILLSMISQLRHRRFMARMESSASGEHTVCWQNEWRIEGNCPKKGSLVYIVERESGNLIAMLEEQSNFAFSGISSFKRRPGTNNRDKESLDSWGLPALPGKWWKCFDEDDADKSQYSLFRQQGLTGWLLPLYCNRNRYRHRVPPIIFDCSLLLFDRRVYLETKVDHRSLQPVSNWFRLPKSLPLVIFPASWSRQE